MIDIKFRAIPGADFLEAAVESARNAFKSTDLSDSFVIDGMFFIGEKDKDLLTRLVKAGPEHRKNLRMIPLILEIEAPIYWWKQFETYTIGTQKIDIGNDDITSYSESTMHTITKEHLRIDNFSTDGLTEEDIYDLEATIYRLNYLIDRYNETKDPLIFDRIIKQLPSSYNQKRMISMNYEVVRNICHQRSGHKLGEWKVLRDKFNMLPMCWIFNI